MKAAPAMQPRALKAPTHRVKIAQHAPMRFDPPSFLSQYEERKVWVEGALPGEEAEVRLLRKGPTGAWDAIATQILTPSPERVQPRCVVQDKCGGCPLMHMDPKAQLKAKEQVLLDAFKEVGLEPREVLAPIDLPDNQYQYRHKARLSVSARAIDTKGVFVGFRERLLTRRLGFVPVVDMNRCEVLAPPLTGIIQPLRQLIQQMGHRAQSIPCIEVAIGDNTAALVFRTLTALNREEEEMLTFFGDKHKLQIYIQPGNPESIVLLRSELGVMRRPLSVHHSGSWQKFALRVGLPNDVTLHFLPNDFTQVNLHMNRLLVQRSLELLTPTRSDNILDLFSGIGNFSLPLARQAGKVLGVELVVPLVHRAQENARLNGISNAHFRTMDLYKDVRDAKPLLQSADYTKMLIDPPRSGAYEVCQMLVEAAHATQLLYVSCNPLTLARDAAVLTERGKYKLQSVGVANMFPHTGHVESLALFVK